MPHRSTWLLTITALLLIYNPAAAFRPKKAPTPPHALLVELMTRKSQVDYIRRFKPHRLEELNKDITGVMKATLQDFATNFEYLPVYFFIDSNADMIRKGHFEGVLLDGQMKPVQQNILHEGDTSFFIAYYGSYMPQPEKMKSKTGTNTAGAYLESYGDDPTALRPTLLVLDHKFELLELPKPRRPKVYISITRRQNRELYYRSRRYEIDYTPLAASYDATLTRYYRQR